MAKDSGNKPPVFRTLTTARKQQFLVNMASRDEGTVEIFRPKGDGQLIPIAEVSLPKEFKREDHDPRKLREHIIKELSRLQYYVAAQAEFKKGNVTLRDDPEALATLLDLGTDKRRTRHEEEVPKSKRRSS